MQHSGADDVRVFGLNVRVSNAFPERPPLIIGQIRKRPPGFPFTPDSLVATQAEGFLGISAKKAKGMRCLAASCLSVQLTCEQTYHRPIIIGY